MTKQLTISFAALAIAALGVSCSSGGTAQPLQPGTVSAAAAPAGKYIVVLKPGSSVADITALSAVLASAPGNSYEHVFRGFAGQLSAAEHAILLQDPRVDYIEPDFQVSIVKGPPGGGPPGGGGGGGGGGSDPAQQTPWGVDRIDADLNVANNGNGIGVAVIDTGVDLDHPDLFDVVGVVEANFDKPGNLPDDDNGHGTHVAGTIAAANNMIGYVGVAPEATIIAVKVLNRRGSGWVSDINAGIDWVAANQSTYNIKVANMSLGGYGYSASMHDAIASATSAGVTFVVAAGNESDDATFYSPAGFNDTVITVSALNPNDTFAYYSNHGNSSNGSPIDLIAPGTSVPSLWKNGDYNTISGTSMASPHVAGAAALYCASHAGATFNQVLSGLVGASESGTWSGDPDGHYEPLVDAAAL